MSTLNIPLFYRRLKRNPYIIHICLLTFLLTLHYDLPSVVRTTNKYLEQISMVQKVLEPLRFDCYGKIVVSYRDQLQRKGS